MFATLYNKAFVLKEYEYKDQEYIVGDYRIEDVLVRDAASTKSLKKRRDKIIFPYQIVEGKRVDYTEKRIYKKNSQKATEYF